MFYTDISTEDHHCQGEQGKYMAIPEGPFDEALKLLAHILAEKHLLQQKEIVPRPAKDVRSQKRKGTDIGKKDLEG